MMNRTAIRERYGITRAGLLRGLPLLCVRFLFGAGTIGTFVWSLRFFLDDAFGVQVPLNILTVVLGVGATLLIIFLLVLLPLLIDTPPRRSMVAILREPVTGTDDEIRNKIRKVKRLDNSLNLAIYFPAGYVPVELATVPYIRPSIKRQMRLHWPFVVLMCGILVLGFGTLVTTTFGSVSIFLPPLTLLLTIQIFYGSYVDVRGYGKSDKTVEED